MDRKTATAIGYQIRVNLNSQWRLINSLNRTVAVRPIDKDDDNFQSCHDCNGKSSLLVVELTRFTPKGRLSDNPLVWGWCGVCDIGGTDHES
jgi:hypothetical protein